MKLNIVTTLVETSHVLGYDSNYPGYFYPWWVLKVIDPCKSGSNNSWC